MKIYVIIMITLIFVNTLLITIKNILNFYFLFFRGLGVGYPIGFLHEIGNCHGEIWKKTICDSLGISVPSSTT